MRGLRKQEDITFERYFELVQKSANDKDCTFFCDTVQGIEFSLGEIEGDVLTGWLIPNQSADLFEGLFTANAIDRDTWDQFYVEVSWKLKDDEILISFS
ncbi:MAG: hypothetical protein LKF79_05920 [Solobacterium sp.]|jgi:hypothetical protein|nr:hypothetical protein [Solobacterium sp.]MCH4222982.1 hypothetical protein [Solobacterium sp.]MCH4266162.1 hypothetical protein [Solobacterium sp.]